MKTKRQYLIVIGFFAAFLAIISLSFSSEASTLKDRERFAEDLTSELFQKGQVISCVVADKNGTTLNVVSTLSPNIEALLFAFAKPATMRRLKAYGFKKVLVQGIGWENGVSQGVQTEKTILLK